MPIPIDASEVLDREFLDIRARLLHVAASLDRLERAEGSVEDDPRLAKLREAVALLIDGEANRAERLQLLFSRPYQSDWKTALAVPKTNSHPR